MGARTSDRQRLRRGRRTYRRGVGTTVQWRAAASFALKEMRA